MGADDVLLAIVAFLADRGGAADWTLVGSSGPRTC